MSDEKPEVATPDNPTPPPPIRPEPKGARWGDPFAHFEKKWVEVEVYLIVAVLIGEILSLCAWIFLKGLSTPPTVNKAGVVLRGVLLAVSLGCGAWFGLSKLALNVRRTATIVSICVGLVLGRVTAGIGVEYGSNLVNWYQDASTLTLIGGLRGLGTRLTIWLAMLGASLATSSGKHINIDVVMRFLPTKGRVPAAVAAWLAASVVCSATSWGFVDHIAISAFGAPLNGSAFEKIEHTVHEGREHFFILRRQVGIDMTVGFRVFGGKTYSEALLGSEWNEKIKTGGYEDWLKADEVKALLVPPEREAQTITPLINMPGKTMRSLLVEDLNMLFPFGFFMLGLKFLLRVVLAISGHVEVDPDAAHRDDEAVERHNVAAVLATVDAPHGEEAAESGANGGDS
ncbi:MAG: TRAP transporter small permease subunit [Polyangiaceae bacterium]